MKPLFNSIVVALTLATSATVIDAQVRGATTQTALAQDGRKVILRSDGTWTYADDKTAEVGKALSQLSFETGVVFKSGDVKPVARALFYLLDESLEKILADNGFIARNGSSLLSEFVLKSVESKRDHLRGITVTEYDRLLVIIKSHVVASATTGFDGKGQFNAIKPGTYYLMNQSEIGRSYVLWNLAVALKPGSNSVSLDQNNAAVAF